jgi:hypothetical protein
MQTMRYGTVKRVVRRSQGLDSTYAGSIARRFLMTESTNRSFHDLPIARGTRTHGSRRSTLK